MMVGFVEDGVASTKLTVFEEGVARDGHDPDSHKYV